MPENCEDTRKIHNKLVNAGMEQSMFYSGNCIVSGPMEGFRGILQRERCYGNRFASRDHNDEKPTINIK